MTDTDRDSTRLRENAPEKPVQRDSGDQATQTPSEPISVPQTPFHGISRHMAGEASSKNVFDLTFAEALAEVDRLRGEPQADRKGGRIDWATSQHGEVAMGGFYRFVPAERVEELEAQLAEARDEATGLAHDRAAAEVAADTLTRQLAEERAKVAALSQPRVFTLSGVVDADLAERYETLRGSYEQLSGILVDKDRRIAGLEADLAEVTGQLETATAQLADVTAERDAAAENARRERDDATRFRRLVERQSNWTDAEVERVSPAQVRYVSTAVVGGADPVYPPFGHHAIPAKPRCRVVTSPRFYGFDEQRAAADALDKHTHDLGFHMREMHRLELVETVAKALGLRRA